MRLYCECVQFKRMHPENRKPAWRVSFGDGNLSCNPHPSLTDFALRIPLNNIHAFREAASPNLRQCRFQCVRKRNRVIFLIKNLALKNNNKKRISQTEIDLCAVGVAVDSRVDSSQSNAMCKSSDCSMKIFDSADLEIALKQWNDLKMKFSCTSRELVSGSFVVVLKGEKGVFLRLNIKL